MCCPADNVRGPGPQPHRQHGADKVYHVRHDIRVWSTIRTPPYTKRPVPTSSTERKPQIVLYGATADRARPGPSHAPLKCKGRPHRRLHRSADLGDYRGLQADQDAPTRTYSYQIRPAFGGNIIATIVNHRSHWPQMATVREGVMPMAEPNG